MSKVTVSKPGEMSAGNAGEWFHRWAAGPLRSPHYKISSKDFDQDPTRRKCGRNQNRHRATARAIRHARTPQRVARAKKKCFRLSASDPTRAKSREGCICKHKIGTAPQRDSKNHSSDRTLTSDSQYEMRLFDVL